jgi:quercetin dioxygenase-like cupin family protein
MEKEIKIIKVSENPAVPVPDHKGCTAQEIAGDLLGIKSCVVKFGVYEPEGTADEHFHEKSEHVFYILSGALTIFADGKAYTAKAGEGMYVPAGIPHSGINRTKGYTTYIAVTLPPG